MDGIEGLFGAIGEMLGGLAGAAAEGAPEAVVAGAVGAATSDEPGASATFERYLAGAPRALNVNDL
ncbi:MAG TPA: hypothetical protein VN224_06885 [Xanthomonadales bacterium]|nr:hypothetical protein [Xanthomonadales bacterium]